jgi:hypothetical protein
MVDMAQKSRLRLYAIVAIISCTATAIGVAWTSYTVLALINSNPTLALYREVPDTAPVSGWYGPRSLALVCHQP